MWITHVGLFALVVGSIGDSRVWFLKHKKGEGQTLQIIDEWKTSKFDIHI